MAEGVSVLLDRRGDVELESAGHWFDQVWHVGSIERQVVHDHPDCGVVAGIRSLGVAQVATLEGVQAPWDVHSINDFRAWVTSRRRRAIHWWEQGQDRVVEAQSVHRLSELIPGLKIMVSVQSKDHYLILVDLVLDVGMQVFDGFEDGVEKDVLAGPVVQLLNIHRARVVTFDREVGRVDSDFPAILSSVQMPRPAAQSRGIDALSF